MVLLKTSKLYVQARAQARPSIMSRRASLFAKQNPDKPRPKVRFSDELVFLDNIKENDIPALGSMLRRASLQIDISGINDAGEYIFKRQIMK